MSVLSRVLLWALLPAAALCAENATTQEQTVEAEEVPVTDVRARALHATSALLPTAARRSRLDAAVVARQFLAYC